MKHGIITEIINSSSRIVPRKGKDWKRPNTHAERLFFLEKKRIHPKSKRLPMLGLIANKPPSEILLVKNMDDFNRIFAQPATSLFSNPLLVEAIIKGGRIYVAGADGKPVGVKTHIVDDEGIIIETRDGF